MARFLLAVFLFQFSPLVDIPVSNFHVSRISLIESSANKEICITTTIKPLASNADFSQQVIGEQVHTVPLQPYTYTFSFDVLLYFLQILAFFAPIFLIAIFHTTTLLKKSKILDIEPLPS